MPYKISLTTVGGQRVQLPEVHHGLTPEVGDRITVNIAHGATHAQVAAVHKYPSRSSGIAIASVDDVEAQEL